MYFYYELGNRIQLPYFMEVKQVISSPHIGSIRQLQLVILFIVQGYPAFYAVTPKHVLHKK